MAAEDSPQSIDTYIIARLAIWAGDFDFAQQLLESSAPLSEYGAMPEVVSNTEEMIRYAAAFRHRQLLQKKGEFGNIQRELADLGVEVVSQPMVVPVTHVRGAIWRTGVRHFQMRAYLSDLAWEPTLFRLASEQIRRFGEEQSLPHLRSQVQVRKRFDPLGGSWVQSGNPFVEITLSDMGLIEANAVWVDRARPSEMSPFLEAFTKILKSLDFDSSVGQSADTR